MPPGASRENQGSPPNPPNKPGIDLQNSTRGSYHPKGARLIITGWNLLEEHGPSIHREPHNFVSPHPPGRISVAIRRNHTSIAEIHGSTVSRFRGGLHGNENGPEGPWENHAEPPKIIGLPVSSTGPSLMSHLRRAYTKGV